MDSGQVGFSQLKVKVYFSVQCHFPYPYKIQTFKFYCLLHDEWSLCLHISRKYCSYFPRPQFCIVRYDFVISASLIKHYPSRNTFKFLILNKGLHLFLFLKLSKVSNYKESNNLHCTKLRATHAQCTMHMAKYYV